MDDLGFKAINQMPPKQRRHSKYTAFLDKVKRSKRVYVKKFDDRNKTRQMASALRAHIKSHQVEDVEVIVRDMEVFVFNSNNREEEIDA